MGAPVSKPRKKPGVGLFEMNMPRGEGRPGALKSDLATVRDACGDCPFAVAVDHTGPSSRIEGVVVLNSPAGGRSIADQRSAAEIETRLNDRQSDEATASFRFFGHGHGVRFAATEKGKHQSHPAIRS